MKLSLLRVRRAPALAKLFLAGLIPIATLVAFTSASDAAVTNCATSSPTGAYTVKVCITAPAGPGTVSGNVTTTASVSVTGTSPGVAKTYWIINGGLLLTDFATPHTFTLYTDDFADGVYTIAVVARLRDGNSSAPVSLQLTFANGNASTPVNPATWTPPTPPVNPWGTPMVVAAGGDGAGGEANSTNVINTMASWNPALFLYLGDVYEDGTLTEFRNWYGTGGSWFDTFRGITLPVIGNHEYDGGGFWPYWDNIPHYFSFNANGWHFVGLDTTSQYNQSAPGTAQYDWLAADLAANDSPCTVVFGHHPLYNVGKEGPTTRLDDMWKLMADEKVTMFLTGHDHTYQRWHPLNRNGVSNANGVIELIAGTGGHSSQSPLTSDSRVAVKLKAYGAFRMDLLGTGMNFKFVNSTGTTLDQGSIPCKGHDGIAPTPPTGLDGTATPTGVFLNWTPATDNFGVTSYTVYRDNVAIGSATGGNFIDNTAPSASNVTYKVEALDAAGNATMSTSLPIFTGGSDTDAPSIPAGLTAILAPDRSVTLNWSDSTDNVGVTHYTVYRDGVAVASPTVSDFVDNLPLGLEDATYWVTASDAAANESGPSNAVLVATYDVTPPGTPPGLVGSATGPNAVTLSWGAATDNVAVTHYRVYQDGNQLARVPATTLTFDYASVLSETTHSYEVRAEDGQGNMSSVPASVSITQPAAVGINAAADSWINAASPTAGAGTSTLMRSDADPIQRPYFRFDLSGVQGQVERARLRIYANTRSTTAVQLRTSTTGWQEATLNWNNAPSMGPVISTIPAWPAAGWITVDVTAQVNAGQQIGFVLNTTSTTSATYAAKESGTSPQLLLDIYP